MHRRFSPAEIKALYRHLTARRLRAQLFFAGIIVICLFIATNICENIIWKAFSPYHVSSARGARLPTIAPAHSAVPAFAVAARYAGPMLLVAARGVAACKCIAGRLLDFATYACSHLLKMWCTTLSVTAAPFCCSRCVSMRRLVSYEK
jgi:hypothetical protein